jgi:pyruvate/2-oxoacid:ferredoxin oxidoreductase alpha subunit
MKKIKLNKSKVQYYTDGEDSQAMFQPIGLVGYGDTEEEAFEDLENLAQRLYDVLLIDEVNLNPVRKDQLRKLKEYLA